MGIKKAETDGQLQLALGAQFVDALQESPSSRVRELATTPRAQQILKTVQYVMDEEPLPNFLHSAMCAMSLPVQQPKDDMAPIIRRDGNYSLIIQPRTRMEPIGPNGEFRPVSRGVPWGRHARLVLYFIMTEAVTKRSREVYLGKSFSGWLRRMGLSSTASGGKKGSRTAIQEQVDRLMNCEWTMRWDEDLTDIAEEGAAGKGGRRSRSAKGKEPAAISAFSVSDMQLVNKYSGMRSDEGTFISHFVLSEAFYENLLKHSVPINDRAIVALKKSATQLDLYTWLAYRLPRIEKGKTVRLKWSDLANHLGNDTKEMYKFRQTVRLAWDVVSGVYQQARWSVELNDLVILLRYADPPTKGHLVMEPDQSSPRGHTIKDKPKGTGLLKAVDTMPESRASKPLPSAANRGIVFPKAGPLQWGYEELYRAAIEHGSGNDVTKMADAFRKTLGDELDGLTGDKLLKRWVAYCQKWPKPA